MIERGLSRSEILNKLNLSLHGDLKAYIPVIGSACSQDPEFLAHVISWDFINGQIKDTKIALPVITIASREFPDELVENSLAHLAMQPPRELLKALRFSIDSSAPARRQKKLESVIRSYLAYKEREPGKWNRLAVRHRRSLKSLYALTHTKMPEWVADILVHGRYIPGSIFADISNLHRMASAQAAATIAKWHLSPLIVSGAMAGSKVQGESNVVQATMEQMSDTEVVTRVKSLEKKGLSRDAGLKETFRKKVAKATKSSKATLKTSIAAEEVEDESIKTMLRELQERQIQAQKDAGRGIDGNWLVISDRSLSQDVAIKLGVHVAATIAKFVTGKVHLVFCNREATPMDVTGKSLEQIMGQAKFIVAHGNTSYGIGLSWATEKRLSLDGVVIVGDGGENTSPLFFHAYEAYQKIMDKNLPVYFYQTYCEPRYANTPGGNPRNFENLMSGGTIGYGYTTGAKTPIPVTKFDFTSGKIDFYSLPNVVQSMNASRFGVVEKIMACPLVTLEQVIPQMAVAKR
jgi:DNA-binding MarR family transcriptional regulator